MSKCLDVCYLLFAVASEYFSGTAGGGIREKNTTGILKIHIIKILY